MKAFFSIIFVTLFTSAFSSEITLVWNNKWFNPENRKTNSPFDNATELSEYGHLPFFQQTQIFEGKLNSFDVEFTTLKTEALTASELKNLNDIALPESFIVKKQTGQHLKNGVAEVYISSIRKNALGIAEKLISFQLQIKNASISPTTFASKSAYKSGSSSVLASGKWYKLKVTSTGLYKIDKALLQSMGVDPASINPKNLRIYGNGGGMLPELIKTYTPDDLRENAIMVAGENDGVFNDNDYALFYATGPHTWTYDTLTKKYSHKFNVYSDAAYYYITFDLGAGKRVGTQLQNAGAATHTTTKFDDYSFQENDSYNLIKSGKTWFGDLFNVVTKERSYSFSFPNMDLSTPALMNTQLAVRSSQTSSMTVQVNGSSLVNLNGLSPISSGYDDPYATIKTSVANSFTPSSSSFNIKMTYNLPSGNNEAECWLNYLEVIVRRNLTLSGNGIVFRDANTTGKNNIVEYQISGNSGSEILWDITDLSNIKAQAYEYNGGQIKFTQTADTLKEYMLFSGSNFALPKFVEVVSNQDIHGKGIVDYVIVVAPEFWNAAQKLSDFHKTYSNLDVLVVTPDQVYNEFSSGSKDVTAIRNMMRYFYKNASSPQELPKYLLLFGDGSYDFKSKIAAGDFVPVYESAESIDPTSSYATDDYFGFLDDNEGNMDPNSSDNVDIGIGRFPVTSLEQANGVVNKVISYSGHGSQVATNSTLTPYIKDVYGNWRNQIVFIADDGSDPNGNYDYAEHVSGCETMSDLLRNLDSNYNHQKIYFDAYLKQSSAGGGRYPDVERSINQALDKGALVVSYVGHGGEAGWADERVLSIQQINQWSNFTNLPFFITATCEFSRFDDPQRVAAGEYVLNNSNGGAIGQLTTTRLVYGSSNLDFTKNFFKSTFINAATRPTLGQALTEAKALTGNGTYNNKRKFFLMGDPAVTLAFPENKVVTTAINQQLVSNSDTIKALMKVKVEGKMVDRQGAFLSSYNGIIYPTVYDKAQQMQTLNNVNKSILNFDVQNNILYKGKATVSKGLFSFEFIVPKDISYQFGNGKISYYAANKEEDACGFYENFIIGGSDTNALKDESGPEVHLYMNDSSFVMGGLTDQNPKIFAVLYDESGINTTGSNIGHDIVATLDKQSSQSIILNSYYEANLDSYKKGTINYPLENLSEGEHQLTLKVWDVNNNSAEKNTVFVVSSSAELALSHVLNYPNPFTTSTEFWFEHNHATGSLNVQIQIFTISGKLVKNINTTIDVSERYKPTPIQWDGLDDFGDSIGKGVYVYRLKVQTENGEYAEKTEKLVILK
ncbi:MAG: type IX secretion system sortase PorU [Bacteroidetes bacterium]|nr:type IX secretion system sortase PorU [Bacteroidota bacterium]